MSRGEPSGPAGVIDHHPKPRPFWRVLVPLTPWVAWVLLFGIALCFDARVADAVHDDGIAAALRRHPQWLAVWKSPGDFWFTIAVAAAGWWLCRWGGRQIGFLLLAVAFSGLNVLPKWVVGRTRPFKLGPEHVAQPFQLQPFRYGLDGFFHQENLSFPSGHECTAFALALAICVVQPRAAAPFFLIALAVGLERVLENAHYCSDVMAAMPVAALGVWLAYRMIGAKPRAGLESGASVPAI